MSKGRVQKPESRVSSVRGGGGNPLSPNFFPLVFRIYPSAMGEGGVPPLSVKFFFVKNRPKNSVFWAKNAVFGGKFVEFRPLWGGGYPPFPLTFFAKFSRPL